MREIILDALRREPAISGEQLGKRLRISRTAVWKHINELRKDGYIINSSPQTGYSLIAGTDLLLPEEIKSGLETRILGTRIIRYQEVTSTQDIAAEFARAGMPEGATVIAEGQTEGRGRKGREWVSPGEGGIYVSIILRPRLKPFQTIQIPLIAGIAVCKAIKKITFGEPKIKWPNDILIGGKKVAGILTEMNSEVDSVNYIVLGVGINVNTAPAILQKISGGRAGSLSWTNNGRVSRVKLLQHFLNELDVVYSTFLSDGFQKLRHEWKKLSDTLGSQVYIRDGGEVIEGIALDIDKEGFLLVKKETGELVKVVSGDVLPGLPA